MTAARRALAAAGVLLALLVAAPAHAALPPVKHVFVVVLENKDFSETFGPNPPAPYLGRDLPAQGMLLQRYYGIGHLSLDNYLAMISGQGPNPFTQADSPLFADMLPGVIGPDGQAMGAGSVYPASVKTVADQLAAKGLTWGGYMEDMGNGPGEPQTCRHPAVGAPDSTQQARVGDQYATRHNPFVYFHSIIDSPACAANVVPLDRLPAALEGDTVPNFTFITPNLCNDGHDSPCVDGAPGGYVSIDAWLRTWVPRILSSRAYQDGGMLMVTFDESENGAEGCCGAEQQSANTPNAGGPQLGPGGGIVGAVVLSPYVKPGTTDATSYNHYSLLRTVEDLFGLAPLGYAAKATAFGDDVFNAPPPPMAASGHSVVAGAPCVQRPLPAGSVPDLPRGALLAAVRRSGRTLRIDVAHSSDLWVRAMLSRGGTKRVLARRGKPCTSVRTMLPRGTRSAAVTATVHGKRERRTIQVSQRRTSSAS